MALAPVTAMKTADGLYLYGILPRGDANWTADGFGPVRLIEHGWCAVLASDVARSDWRGRAIEDAIEIARRAQTHFSVLQAALECATPVPMRFGTVIGPAALDEFLAMTRPSIEAGLAVAGQGREWVVHLSPDPEQVETQALNDPELRALDQRISEAGAGAAYLLTKKRTRCLSQYAARMAKRARGSLARQLEPLAVSRTALSPRAGEVERTAWLVPRESETGFVAAARRAAAEASVGIRLVGPLPPYSFVPAGAERGADAG